MKHLVSCKTRLPAGQARSEQGFVQGVLLFALAVLVAIIAAFAFANNGNQSSSERENAKVTATVLMKQASDVQDAVSRYISDGQSLMYLCVTSGVAPATQAVTNNSVVVGNCATHTGGTPVYLFDLANGYITPPEPPNAAFAASLSSTSRVWTYADFSQNGRNLLATSAPQVYAFMQAEDLDKKVCQSINRMLNLTWEFLEANVDDEEEVCYKTTTGGKYVYRKVIANRKPVGA